MPKGSSLPVLSRARFTDRIGTVLKRQFAAFTAEAAKVDPLYTRLVTDMGEFLARGGKRMRPYLTYLAYRGFGGTDEAAITKVAASQELFHNFLLIHDDVMDGDLTRYGGPNLTGVYAARYGRRLPAAAARRLGEGTAIVAGDLGASFGYRVIADSPFPEARKLAAVRLINQMIFDVVGGQLMDHLMPFERTVDERRLERLYTHKTASYSFVTPLQLGAILAGAPEADQRALRRYGQSAGVAFQIADDFLGVFGDEAATGKPATSDMRNGKQTLLFAAARRLAAPADRREFDRIVGNPRAGQRQLATLRRILHRSGAVTEVARRAARRIALAKRALRPVPLTAAVRQALEQVADSSINRVR